MTQQVKVNELIAALNTLTMQSIENLSSEDLKRLKPIISSKEMMVSIEYKKRRARAIAAVQNEKK